jgi:outer membrane lipoprotein-sorting protein
MTSAPRVVPLALACAMIALAASSRTGAADDILPRTRAMYGELRSYADTGVMIHEYGSSSTDEYRFVTRFNRSPRRFYLDSSGGQFVVWGDSDAFHTWTKATDDQHDYPNPNNSPALTMSGVQTHGATGIIPPLLYSKAALYNVFDNFTDQTVDGIETVGGHRCHRILGTTRDVYAATGRENNVRKLTVWIDVDSLLIRKVRQEWKPLPGQRSRDTFLYEPQANPAIDDSQFRFSPPKAR